jgi:hypothetical protein
MSEVKLSELKPAFHFSRSLFMSAVLASAIFLPMAAVYAQDAASSGSCESDIGAIQQKRMGFIGDLNKIAKAGNGKIDPIASCPKLRSLAATEIQLKNYVVKNKEWCNVPDAFINQISEGAARTSQMAQQACKVATEMRKQQQSGGDAAPTGVRLPSGPL